MSNLNETVNTFGQSVNQNDLDVTCIFTIAAWNNYGFVQSFFDAVHAHNPGIKCLVWFPSDTEMIPQIVQEDRKSSRQSGRSQLFEIVTLDKLEEFSPFSIKEIAFKMSLVEFATTIKPVAFTYLFQKHKNKSIKYVLYFDNDCWVQDSIWEIIAVLKTKSVVATPHIVSPTPEDLLNQKDISILKAGVLNFGFVAFSNTKGSKSFLQWWYNRLRYYGYVMLAKGMHFDQNWGNFIQVFFNHEDYYIIRDPRFNIAYWNLHYTGKHVWLDKHSGTPHIQDRRVVFMHLSGVSLFENYDMSAISRHQNRFTISHFPKLRSVLKKYLDYLGHFRTAHFRTIPYAFNSFSNGEPIPLLIKQYYSEMVDTVGALRPYVYRPPMAGVELFSLYNISDPFDVRDTANTIWSWLLKGPYNRIVDSEGDSYISELERLIYNSRSDLRYFFPQAMGGDILRFKSWCKNGLRHEYDIPADIFKKWTNGVTPSNKLQGCCVVGNILHQIDYKFSDRFRVALVLNSLVKANYPTGVIQTVRSGSLNPTSAMVNVGYHNSFNHHKDSIDNLIDRSITRSQSRKIHILTVSGYDLGNTFSTYEKRRWESFYRICYIVWDLSRIPKKWIPALNRCNKIWVPSMFVKDAVVKSVLGSSIKVIPFAYIADEANVSKERNNKYLPEKSVNIPSNCIVLMSSFTYDSDFVRKNPIAVVEAFKQSQVSSAMLILQTSCPKNYLMEHISLIKAIDKDPHIIVIESFDDKYLNKYLYSRADIYISLHRSEGYSYDILESMIMQKIVITTNYGGNLDFLKVHKSINNTHYFIDYDSVQGKVLQKKGYVENEYQEFRDSSKLVQPRIKEASLAIIDATRRIANMMKGTRDGTKAMLEREKLQFVSDILEKKYSAANIGRKLTTILKKIEKEN